MKKLDYTANDDTYPTEVTFENGCTVKIDFHGNESDNVPHLTVEYAAKEKAMNRKEAIKAAIEMLNGNEKAGEIIKALSRTRKPKTKKTEVPAAPATAPTA